MNLGRQSLGHESPLHSHDAISPAQCDLVLKFFKQVYFKETLSTSLRGRECLANVSEGVLLQEAEHAHRLFWKWGNLRASGCPPQPGRARPRSPPQANVVPTAGSCCHPESQTSASGHFSIKSRQTLWHPLLKSPLPSAHRVPGAVLNPCRGQWLREVRPQSIDK